MIKIFTQTDLIRYLYQETTEEENREIDKALQRDKELRDLYSELSAVQKDLDVARLEPSAGTIRNILDYARAKRVH